MIIKNTIKMNGISLELKFDILKKLDIRSLLNFRLVNKYYKEFVDYYLLERKYKKFEGYNIEFDDQVVFYANTCKTQKLMKLNLNLMYTAFTMYNKVYLQFGHGGLFTFKLDYCKKWYICWYKKNTNKYIVSKNIIKFKEYEKDFFETLIENCDQEEYKNDELGLIVVN